MNLPGDLLRTALAERRIDRRGFLTISAEGLAIAFTLPAVGWVADVQAASGEELANAYVHIGTDGSITLSYCGAQMGQDAVSGLAQVLAEELMVDSDQVCVQQSPVDLAVSYCTGDRSVASGPYARLRTAGAAARELLIAAAMTMTDDAARGNYFAMSGTVTHVPSREAWLYSALATTAATLAAPGDLRL